MWNKELKIIFRITIKGIYTSNIQLKINDHIRYILIY